MLSICIAVKNRSKVPYDNRDLLLLPKTIKSIADAKLSEDLEIVVSDFKSDDWPLEDWIEECSGSVNTIIVPVDSDFSLGKGRNMAASNAKGDVLLFLDADVMVDSTSLKKGIELVREGNIVFPYITYIQGDGTESKRGKLSNGSGICFISKKRFENVGEWPEFYSWGGEDCAFLNRLRGFGCQIERPKMHGLKHQWHPHYISHENYIKKSGTCYQEFISGIKPKPSKKNEITQKTFNIISEPVLKKDKAIIISRFLKKEINNSFLEEYDAVIRVDLSPTEGYEETVGSRTTHEFSNRNKKKEYSILRKSDKAVFSKNEYEIPMTFHNDLFRRAKIKSVYSMTPELTLADWLTLFYKKVYILGHFENVSKDKIKTYYGLEYSIRKYDVKSELRFLKKLEENNKIIIL